MEDSPLVIPKSILFACNQNAIRSPMAAALADQHCRRRIYIDSVGVRPGKSDPFAMVVMDELGLDLQDHVPKSFDDVEGGEFDLVITLTPEAHHKALLLTLDSDVEVEYWPTLDPSLTTGNREQILDAYRAVRDGLADRIRARLKFDAIGHL